MTVPTTKLITLGRGAVLEGARTPRQRGRISWDSTALYLEAGWVRLQDPVAIASWGEVLTLAVDGSEANRHTTSASYRKGLQVRHTRGRTTTRQQAFTMLTVGLPDDVLVIKLSRSPAQVRAKIGPMLARFRERT